MKNYKNAVIYSPECLFNDVIISEDPYDHM